MPRPASKAFLRALARSAPNNRGRSTTGGPAVPYYPESDAREAAKHLRLTAARFLAERVTPGDLDEACDLWRAARVKKAR